MNLCRNEMKKYVYYKKQNRFIHPYLTDVEFLKCTMTYGTYYGMY